MTSSTLRTQFDSKNCLACDLAENLTAGVLAAMTLAVGGRSMFNSLPLHLVAVLEGVTKILY